MHRDQQEFVSMLRDLDGEGREESSEQILALLCAELHEVAARMMASVPPGATLQATALVSEAYLRLAKTRGRTWKSRAHLISSAGRAMRNVLIDHARKRAGRRLGSEESQSALDRVLVTYQDRVVDILALDQALDKLATLAPEMARAVELRFFAGLSMEQVADVLEMPKRTLEREWETTRAWLLKEIS